MELILGNAIDYISRASQWEWIDRLRASRNYDLALRAAGSAWFLLLAIMVVGGAPTGADDGDAAPTQANGWLKALSQGGLVVFYLTLWLLIIIRPAPVGRANGILPSAVALAGTYMPWLIVMFPQQELSDTGRLVATALILSGNVLTIAVIWCLGRSFSFVPEARRLVTAGPYFVIRHPLYVAEEVMFAGTTLLYLSPVTLALLALHFGVQVQRMLYEEDVLSRAFPEYASYSRRTWRVVPGVW